MSAFICSENTYSAIYAGLHQFNGGNYANAKQAIDKILAFSSCGAGQKGDLHAKLITDLYALNVEAVNQRYQEINSTQISAGKLEEITRLPATGTAYQFVKSLCCLQYQMSEGDIPKKSVLYKMVTKLISAMCRDIVQNNPLYEKADWD